MRSLAVFVLSVVVVGCGKPTPRTDAPTDAPEGKAASPRDHDRLQGTWAVESLDAGEKEDSGKRAESKKDRFKFEGDKLTLVTPREDEQFTFALDETKTPKELTLTEMSDGPPSPGNPTVRGTTVVAEPEREKLEWIYKFEGETLVLALANRERDTKGSRPTEFKAVASRFERGTLLVPGVSVLTLKKTDDTPVPPRFSTKPSGTRK